MTPRTRRRGGFEYSYGFIGGENNQWDPALYEGTTPIEPPATPEEGYHLTEDLADHAVNCTTVSPDCTAQDSRFTGKITWVQIAVGTDDHDHFIDPEERVRIAMATQ
jgi:arylsulfatase A-like enzyme